VWHEKLPPLSWFQNRKEAEKDNSEKEAKSLESSVFQAREQLFLAEAASEKSSQEEKEPQDRKGSDNPHFVPLNVDMSKRAAA
jgi:hypothetical protein